MTTSTPSRAWRVGDRGWLQWLETVLELAAAGAAGAALTLALGGPLEWAGPARGAQVGVLAALAFGLTLAIAERVVQRDLLALCLGVVSAAAHWSMVVALEISADVGALLVAFAALMLAGQLVKLRFLASSGVAVRDLPRPFLYVLTSIFAVGYAALLALAPL